MGGGSRLEAAFRFLCERANGGDFLVLSANDDDDYLEKENAMIRSICPLNSVATLSFFSREDARDPEVIKIIEQAESIFIAGGDQSDYVRYWQDTPVQERVRPGKTFQLKKWSGEADTYFLSVTRGVVQADGSSSRGIY